MDNILYTTPQEQIEKLNRLAQKRGETLAQMALKWVLKDHDITSVLIGASRPEQIRENLGALNRLTFTDEEKAEIRALL